MCKEMQSDRKNSGFAGLEACQRREKLPICQGELGNGYLSGLGRDEMEELTD
jgi:hypothetical protein